MYADNLMPVFPMKEMSDRDTYVSMWLPTKPGLPRTLLVSNYWDRDELDFPEKVLKVMLSLIHI